MKETKFTWDLVTRGSDGRKVMREISREQPKYIYHMLRWEHAKTIFRSGALRLSPLQSWQDPYEKWWCEQLFDRHGPLAGFRAYGSCWTTGAYDEPRWRMAGFGKESTIVRIRCRPTMLLSAASSLISHKAGSLFLGNVVYRGAEYLLQLANSVSQGSRKEVTRMAASMLLHKRRAFKFEHEVRLLWMDKQEPEDAVLFRVDPHHLISQIMISPHSSQADRNLIKQELKEVGVDCVTSGILRQPT